MIFYNALKLHSEFLKIKIQGVFISMVIGYGYSVGMVYGSLWLEEMLRIKIKLPIKLLNMSIFVCIWNIFLSLYIGFIYLKKAFYDLI